MSEPTDPKKPVPQEPTGRIGRYLIKSTLGKGAMGVVYVAHDDKMDRDVALKVMAAQLADDAELKTRFEREAKEVLGKMAHPNLVTVFDFDYHTDGSPYFVMELLKGQDLQKRVRKAPPLTLEDKVGIIVRVLNGLNHAHPLGIVHRDIKPANIFILEDGSVKIMDFGVARLSGHTMTADGNIVGTADYMSPEQVKGDKTLDGRSDLFSVGCMLFELVAGRRPFHSDNLMAIFYKITHEEANFDLIPQGGEYDALMPILRKALAKDIDERYQTAFEFAVDLREWLRAHATTASSQHVLESLVDLAAPTHPPAPRTEAPGVTGGFGQTVELDPRLRPGRGTLAPLRAGGRTVVDVRAGAGATMRPGATRVVAAPPVVPRRPQRTLRRSLLPWVALAAAIGATGIGAGYVYWQKQQALATPPTTVAVAPPVTQAPPPTTVATPSPPPVTAAPAPTFTEAEGKAAAQLRAAAQAFKAGSYDKAVAAAQAALREDAQSRGAQEYLERSQKGQQALGRLRAAEAALGRGDLAGAESEAQAASQLAPWDAAVAGALSRIGEAKLRAQREAEGRAQQQRSAQINDLLNRGATALQAKQYEAAIAAYDQVLAVDPGNAVAQNQKGNAITAKAIAEASASGGARAGGAVHTFVAGATRSESVEGRGGSVPEGFEETAGVSAKRGTQAAELPGKIVFEPSPASPKAGDHYKVSVYLMNEGSQPIKLAAMVVTTITDGKRVSGGLAPAASTVAPRDRALIWAMPDQVWKEGTTSWTLEVAVTTAGRETYRNTLAWK